MRRRGSAGALGHQYRLHQVRCMSNPSLFDVLSRSLSLLRRDSSPPGIAGQVSACSDAACDHSYTLDLQRDERALGQFVKRLSVSGVENIRVEYPQDGIVRVRMERPMAEDAWESTIGELVDRCGLRYAARFPEETPSG